MWSIVASIEKTPTRLATKFGVSLARTTPLPSVVTRKVSSASSSAGSVSGCGDQLDQVHVARRVEEVDAAEARAQRGGQRRGELVDRQARGVGRDDRVRREVRRDLGVEVVLPVHALGDRLDHEVAFGEPGEVARRSWRRRCRRRDPWSPAATGSSFFRPSIALLTMPLGSPSLAGRSNRTRARRRWRGGRRSARP